MEFDIDFYSIILIMPLTIMMPMKFAEKCPKCSGFVQTKSVRKSIGLGFVEIPIAQFCLNPVCDWYQDFAEARKPEEIKEGYHLKAPTLERKVPQFKMPELSRNHMIVLGSVVAIIILYFMISFLTPVSNPVDKRITQAQLSELSKNTTNNTTTAARLQETPKVTAAPPTPQIKDVKIEPRSETVKMDVGHGFFPGTITINLSDTIVWNNVENVRPRVVLVSRDGLFEKQLMQEYSRYQYQFNRSGKYTFALAEYGTYKEYPNATGSVIVR
jgi:plastocyanin